MACRWVLVLVAGMVMLAPLRVCAQAVPPATPSPVPASPTQAISIEGFRSAHFGMNEAETRKALEADFKLSGSAVRASENAVQRTPLLSITVPGLVPDGGKATVDYVFGYRSHRLIEVNITWSTALDPASTAARLVQVSTTLQDYFRAETFPAGQVTVNAMMPDGSVLLFRGTDANGHTVALVLRGTVKQDAKEHKVQMTPTVLSLVYAADPAQPDVFRLQKGTF